jgi:hypothetical protein
MINISVYVGMNAWCNRIVILISYLTMAYDMPRLHCHWHIEPPAKWKQSIRCLTVAPIMLYCCRRCSLRVGDTLNMIIFIPIRSSNISLAQALICSNKIRPWPCSVAYNISLTPFGQCISGWFVAFARTLIVTSVLNICVNAYFIFFCFRVMW